MRRVLTFITVAFMLSFAACGNNNTPTNGDNAAPATEQNEAREETTPTPEETPQSTPKPTPTAEDIALGQMYSTHDSEITINEVYIAQTVSVSTGSHSSTSGTATEGNTLIIVDASVKNIGTEQLSLWTNAPYAAYALYDDKYKYESASYFVGEHDIAPLATKTQCLTMEIPLDVDTAAESLVVFISIGSNTYKYTLR